jgi:hypothetical protein
MQISDRSYEKLDRGIRMGLSLWAESERDKRKREEREKVSAEERKYREKQETRQQEAFEWKTEDRQKEKDYDVMRSDVDFGKALIKTGDPSNIRLGAARIVNALNTRWPGRTKGILAFRLDKPDAQSLANWDSDPNLAGKEISLLIEEEEDKSLFTFKSIEEFEEFTNMVFNQKEFLKASKASDAAVAKLNREQIPVRTADGSYWIKKFEMDPMSGNPIGKFIPYTGKVAATKAQRLGLDIKEHEKIIGEKLTPAQKRKKLGYEPKKEKAIATGKKLDEYKKKFDLAMRPFHNKESLYDEFGDLIAEAKSAFDVAWDLIEKAEKDPSSLTAREKMKLNYARRARKVFNEMSELISPGMKPKEEKPTWQQYRKRTEFMQDSGGTTGIIPSPYWEQRSGEGTRPRTRLPLEEEKKFQEWYFFWANKTGINPNPDDPKHKYDYRAAYQQGLEPEMDPRDGKYHWPSVHKDLDHPNRFVNGVDTISGGVPGSYQQPRLGISAPNIPTPTWQQYRKSPGVGTGVMPYQQPRLGISAPNIPTPTLIPRQYR